MEDIQDKLSEIMKIKKNVNFHFDQILNYISLIKDYKLSEDVNPYKCEWLQPLVLDDLITEDNIKHDDLLPNTQVGNILTFNALKVPKVM